MIMLNKYMDCNYKIIYSSVLYSFSRYSGIINNGYDYNLDGSYHILLGHSDGQSKINIDTHNCILNSKCKINFVIITDYYF